MAVRRCQARAKPKGGSVTSKSEDTLANQTHKEKQKQLITFRKWLNNNNNNAAQNEVMCGLAKKPSNVWILDKNITWLKHEKMACDGWFNESGHM